MLEAFITAMILANSISKSAVQYIKYFIYHFILIPHGLIRFQLHHAVHEEKPLGLFWQFRPSTSNYNNTLYHNLLQDLSIRHKTRDRAERQFTQLLLSDGGQKKPAGKRPRGGKKSAEIWVGTMAQTVNSPSYEATNFKCVYPR